MFLVLRNCFCCFCSNFFCTLIVLIIVGDFNSDKEISVNTDRSVIASSVKIARFVSLLSSFNVNLITMHLCGDASLVVPACRKHTCLVAYVRFAFMALHPVVFYFLFVERVLSLETFGAI